MERTVKEVILLQEIEAFDLDELIEAIERFKTFTRNYSPKDKRLVKRMEQFVRLMESEYFADHISKQLRNKNK
jgi:hypothetical protein